MILKALDSFRGFFVSCPFGIKFTMQFDNQVFTQLVK